MLQRDKSPGVHLTHCLAPAKPRPLRMPTNNTPVAPRSCLQSGMCCWFFVPGPFSPNLWLTFPTRRGCAHLQSHHIAPQDGDSSRLRSFCSCTILVTLMGCLSTKRRGHYIWEHLPMHSSLPAHSKQSDPHPTAPEDSKSNSCYNS